MAAQGGAGVLIRPYINGTATTLGGSRQKSIKLNNEVVDVTTSDSSGRWQELLGGVATKKLEVSVSGVLQGSSVEKTTIMNAVINGTPLTTDVVIPGLGTFNGSFFWTDYDVQAEHNKEIPYTCTIVSSGAITFTPA